MRRISKVKLVAIALSLSSCGIPASKKLHENGADGASTRTTNSDATHADKPKSIDTAPVGKPQAVLLLLDGFATCPVTDAKILLKDMILNPILTKSLAVLAKSETPTWVIGCKRLDTVFNSFEVIYSSNPDAATVTASLDVILSTVKANVKATHVAVPFVYAFSQGSGAVLSQIPSLDALGTYGIISVDPIGADCNIESILLSPPACKSAPTLSTESLASLAKTGNSMENFYVSKATSPLHSSAISAKNSANVDISADAASMASQVVLNISTDFLTVDQVLDIKAHIAADLIDKTRVAFQALICAKFSCVTGTDTTVTATATSTVTGSSTATDKSVITDGSTDCKTSYWCKLAAMVSPLICSKNGVTCKAVYGPGYMAGQFLSKHACNSSLATKLLAAQACSAVCAGQTAPQEAYTCQNDESAFPPAN